MKKLLLLSILLLAGNINAQNFEELYNKLNTFNTFEDYDAVDKEIQEAIDYILSQPMMRKKRTKKYHFALKSMIKWMNHTESYSILIFGKVIDASHGDILMQNMYMASMGKYLLEQRFQNGRHINPQKQPDINYGDLPEVRETLLEGAKIFFTYLENVSNVKANKELRKGIKANNSSTLEEYMFSDKD